ncbi:AMP-binding protein [Agrococcus baldri]|uniref:4-coumarate--CoA ligase n=1 Tax=Agrococcus baldri TaxID=153730 RepID=A0AA87UXC2_9MICO|nr:AMP-binding protein [Agrococcus baldri]GEK80267.1 4-coumarate--CoA ligase [Agrococcus baldri]
MFESPHPPVEIPETSVFDLLFADLGETERDHPALVDGASGAVTTYGELVDRSLALAGALAARGLGPGDVVALHSPNVPAFAIAFHGILRSGATATTVNAMMNAAEIGKQLRASGASMLLTVSPLAPQAIEAATANGIAADRIVVLDGLEGHPSLAELLGEARPAPTVTIDPATHVAVMPYSSGTTGHPKGVMLSHRNLVANVAQCVSLIDVRADDRVIAVLPFFHIYGMTVLLNIALKQRATLVTMPRFELTEFLRIIQDERITFAFIAPPIAVALAKHPLVDDHDLSSLHTIMSGAAPLDEALGRAVEQRLGVEMLQGYGMSELSPVSHVIPRGSGAPLRSSGPTIPNMQSKIVDIETGEEIPLPEEGVSARGELWVRGPNVMLRYLDDEAATAETIDADGFLHTGDIAEADAAGNIAIVDRLKELIKYKGYQVAPAELEALLLTSQDVADAAVVGVPDDEAGEIPKAFVVRASEAATAESVMAFVAERVSPYKRVRAVEFIDAIPKSSAGKILRKDLR